MSRTITTSRSARLFAAAGVIGLLATGCTSNTAEPDPAASSAPAGAASDNDAPGETVTIGFSGPAADHDNLDFQRWHAGTISSDPGIRK